MSKGRGDDSAVKSNDCSYGGFRFNPQYPHDNSQLSVIPALGDPTLMANTNEHTIKINLKKESEQKDLVTDHAWTLTVAHSFFAFGRN